MRVFRDLVDSKRRRTTTDSWVPTSIGKSGVSVIVSMAQGSRLRLEINLGHSSAEQNSEWFKILHTHKTEIDNAFRDEIVSWEPLESAKCCRIAVYIPYDKHDIETDLNYKTELFDWINKNITIMRTIATKYLVNTYNSQTD